MNDLTEQLIQLERLVTNREAAVWGARLLTGADRERADKQVYARHAQVVAFRNHILDTLSENS